MDLYVKLPVGKLQELANPLEEPPWGIGEPIQREEILHYLGHAEDYVKNFLPLLEEKYILPNREAHLRCIAYYAAKGWKDAIEIDVGVPVLGCYVDWIVQDGNHRLAAAIFRKDKMILAGVSGDLKYVEELFGPIRPVKYKP